MSGIVGVISKSQKRNISDVNKSLDLMNHRGPDGREVKCGDWGIIGANFLNVSSEYRLSIAEHKETSTLLALDGTILNSNDLGNSLKSSRFFLKNENPAEIMLALYVHCGIEAFNKIIGHASLVIIDVKNHKVFLIRDYCGVRPLYYQFSEESLLFASEIKSILSLTQVRPTLNHDALVDYLTFQHSLDDKTLFSGVKKVTPGCYLEWDYFSDQTPAVKNYWYLRFEPDFNHTEIYFIDKTRCLIEDSVRLNLGGVDQIGAYLSGGLDSSTVVSFTQRMKHSVRLRTFCGKYTESKDYDESEYARCVVDTIGSIHHEIIPLYAEFPELIKDIIYFMDEPQAGPGVFGQYVVAREASRYIKVALSGEGGDEVFLGYAKYLIAYLEECLRGAIFETANHKKFVVTLQSIAENLPLLQSYTGMLQKFWKDGLFDPKEKRYFDLCNRLREIDGIVSPDVFNCSYKVEDAFMRIFKTNNIRSHVNMMSRFDLFEGLQGVLQVDDRTSMAHSVQNRIPLLDHRLVELIASVPPKMKFLGGKQKYLMRRAIDGIVPEKVTSRKDKMGFPLPLNEWFSGPLRDFVFDTLMGKKALERGIFTRSGVSKLLETHEKYGRALWGFLNLELWFQTFIDR